MPEHLIDTSLGKAPALLANIRLDSNGMLGTNPLAFSIDSYIRGFIPYRPILFSLKFVGKTRSVTYSGALEGASLG